MFIMAVKIDYEKCCWKDGKCISCCCEKCEGCVKACNFGVLKRGKLIEIDNSKCTNCGLCVIACKHDAISLI